MELEKELYIAQLIRCALNNESPENKPSDISWEDIYNICKKHSVANMVYPAVQKRMTQQADEGLSQQLIKQWTEVYQKAIVREVTFDMARKEIFNAMEKQGIKYLPLKGILLKDYYPSMGMRTFSDNDILYDSTKSNELNKVMSDLGYEAESFLKGNHDVYMKLPILNFEMHRTLILENQQFYEYTFRVWDRAMKDEENCFRYHMSKEDFYIYFLIHSYKHYCHAGTGLRTLADQYVYLKREEKVLDWDYIQQECSILGLKEFEEKMRRLGKLLLYQKEEKQVLLSKQQKELYLSLLASGTYGCARRRYHNRFAQERVRKDASAGTKLNFMVKRIFPTLSWMKLYYPVLRKAPWLYPAAILFRMVRAALCKRREICSETKAVLAYKENREY